VTCGQCGIRFSGEAKFCSRCGSALTPLDAIPTPKARYVIAFIAGSLAYAGILYRFLSYSERNHLPAAPYVSFAAATFMIGLLVTLGAKRSRYRITSCVLLGAFIGHAIVIAVDLQQDPTNHNLLPFEFVFLGANAAPAYLGTALARLVEHGWRRAKR
jgi:hypothetical protein